MLKFPLCLNKIFFFSTNPGPVEIEQRMAEVWLNLFKYNNDNNNNDDDDDDDDFISKVLFRVKHAQLCWTICTMFDDQVGRDFLLGLWW